MESKKLEPEISQAGLWPEPKTKPQITIELETPQGKREWDSAKNHRLQVGEPVKLYSSDNTFSEARILTIKKLFIGPSVGIAVFSTFLILFLNIFGAPPKSFSSLALHLKIESREKDTSEKVLTNIDKIFDHIFQIAMSFYFVWAGWLIFQDPLQVSPGLASAFPGFGFCEFLWLIIPLVGGIRLRVQGAYQYLPLVCIGGFVSFITAELFDSNQALEWLAPYFLTYLFHCFSSIRAEQAGELRRSGFKRAGGFLLCLVVGSFVGFIIYDYYPGLYRVESFKSFYEDPSLSMGCIVAFMIFKTFIGLIHSYKLVRLQLQRVTTQK